MKKAEHRFLKTQIDEIEDMVGWAKHEVVNAKEDCAFESLERIYKAVWLIKDVLEV